MALDEVIADIEMRSEMARLEKPTTSEIVSAWQKKFNEDNLTNTDLEAHWRLWVPQTYTPTTTDNCLSWSSDEEQVSDLLFRPLEIFICGGDPTAVLERLTQADKPGSVCGRVFKMGEPTYSCRECGMDNTCVLCVDCFKRSEHRHHKYKMGTSGGGGCCDCGDVEAWKRNPHCDFHEARLREQNDSSQVVSEDMQKRTKIVFEAVLWYAYKLLSAEQVSNLVLIPNSEDLYDKDSYCTILYNDEIHTFEQVISTLSKVLKCNQRSAIAYVTNIDREGRAVVKCSDYEHCMDLRSEIEKYTSRHGSKPLKVIVSHSYVIAHQMYAMKLLTWLQEFLGHGETFRRIFADIILARDGPNPHMLRGIFLRDSSLWKSARTQWHKLLISGMLLEYENKKELARVFTKNYGQVMKDFIRDDHDHTFSVSSLSVQLFTVPSIAHYLIADEDVLYLLLNAFNSECVSKCNESGKLEFERGPSSQIFKRAQYMLYDLRYLLGAVPETWTDDLRRTFLHGLAYFLNLLTMMQSMDCVTRQVGQHMEYEPEWESAFHLHIKLASCIALALKWCGSDRVVLIKSYRAVLKKLEENPCYDPNEAGEVRELADHSTACLHYDVSSKPVSIHLPLSRFLAGLHLHLEKYNLTFDSPEFQVVKPTPVQIMEPVVRALVMVAQVHAGMWRRNGYGLLNQLYFYHNVRCRSEMLDRDVILLQMCASLIESNEFLIHLLNKFNLINWATSDFEINSLKSPEEDSMRQTINLIEEFLQLLIVIIGERCVPGISDVTPQDRVKKEIIQHLCIKPLPHSELYKNIPDDITEETTILDDVINELATFKKPTQSAGKGVYDLKNEYYNNYNVFFYHYTREELSKSEEAQRKRRKNAGELECCPPPPLLKLNESFAMLVNLLQCDVMLHIMQTVLNRCLNLRARSFSELQLHKVLHLIGYALHEEESKNYPFFKFIENSSKFELLKLLESLLTCPRVDAHKDLLKWTINKYKQIANSTDEVTTLETTETAETADNEKERRSKLAAERRAKIMAKMSAMQKNFMKENAGLFESESKPHLDSYESAMEVTENVQQPIALGPNQTVRVSLENTYTCILCQEEETVRIDGPTLVLAAFVQQSTVLCQHKNNDELLDLSKHDPLYLHSNLGPAPHTSTCGHIMHGDCWRKYFDNVMTKEHRRPYRMRHPVSYDVDKQEFLCPLCECLSNTVLPLVPPLNTLQPSNPMTDVTFSGWLTCIEVILNKKAKVCHGIFKCDESCENIHCNACINASNATLVEPEADSTVCEANCTLQPHQVFFSLPIDSVLTSIGNLAESFAKLLPTSYPELDSNLRDMIQLFAQVTYTRGLNVHPHPSDKRIAPMTWKSLAYTVHSIEVLLRDSNKALLGQLSSRQRDCIESLVRIVGVLGCTWDKSVIINSHALHLLSILLEHPDEGPSILQWDSFGFLVSLTFSLPSLSCNDTPTPIPTGGILEWHTLRLIFISHVVRILILLNPSDLIHSMETDSQFDNEQELTEVLRLLNKNNEGISSSAVWEHVQYASLPFLRCCVLFYHYLTDVPAPSALQEVGGDTFANMCTYLDLPQTPKALFDDSNIMTIIEKWCNHEEVRLYLSGTAIQVVYEPLQVNKLIDLPHDYSEIINTVSSFTCPKSEHDDSRNPTMCLVCGEILCSQSYCCQTELNKVVVGACNYHASKCGAGVGVFLRVRECEILFLASPHRGCFLPPPYLDDYGETDQGLRRGNPLKLCPERYRKLQTLWLSHSIHEEIARTIESSNHIVANQWHHL